MFVKFASTGKTTGRPPKKTDHQEDSVTTGARSPSWSVSHPPRWLDVVVVPVGAAAMSCLSRGLVWSSPLSRSSTRTPFLWQHAHPVGQRQDRLRLLPQRDHHATSSRSRSVTLTTGIVLGAPRHLPRVGSAAQDAPGRRSASAPGPPSPRCRLRACELGRQPVLRIRSLSSRRGAGIPRSAGRRQPANPVQNGDRNVRRPTGTASCAGSRGRSAIPARSAAGGWKELRPSSGDRPCSGTREQGRAIYLAEPRKP